jgi:hypothetical protein
MSAPFKITRLVFFFSLLVCLQSDAVPPPPPGASVSFQLFYDQLSPFGTWIDYPGYGYVWTPFDGPDFVPYGTNGHWVWTDDGWLWLSDYNWGWAPFHYGRWFHDDYYGWLWIPGNEWGPAWVCWRSSPGYFGWVALGPSVGVELFFGYNYYGGRRDSWVYLPERYMTSEHPYRYYGPRSGNAQFLRNSTVVNRTSGSGNARYVSGPDRASVERATGTHLNPVSINARSSPGHSLQGNQLSIYRPALSRAATDKPAPSQISNRNTIRPVSERTSTSFFKTPPPVQKQERAAPANTASSHRSQPAATRSETPFEHPSSQPRKEEPEREPIQKEPPHREALPPAVPHNHPPSGGGHRGPR